MGRCLLNIENQDNFLEFGRFYIEGFHEALMHGALKREDGVTYLLVHNTAPECEPYLDHLEPPRYITGELHDGVLVRLGGLNFSPTHWDYNDAYTVNELLVTNLPGFDATFWHTEMLFTTVEFRIPHVSKWLDGRVPLNRENELPTVFNITGIDAVLSFEQGENESYPSPLHTLIERYIKIKLTYQQAKSVLEIRSNINILRDFFSLFFAGNVWINQVTLYDYATPFRLFVREHLGPVPEINSQQQVLQYSEIAPYMEPVFNRLFEEKESVLTRQFQYLLHPYLTNSVRVEDIAFGALRLFEVIYEVIEENNINDYYQKVRYVWATLNQAIPNLDIKQDQESIRAVASVRNDLGHWNVSNLITGYNEQRDIEVLTHRVVGLCRAYYFLRLTLPPKIVLKQLFENGDFHRDLFRRDFLGWKVSLKFMPGDCVILRTIYEEVSEKGERLHAVRLKEEETFPELSEEGAYFSPVRYKINGK
ncbi:hypothetical protein J7E55_21585 [Bacillus sp. ISL-53]|nr:hypothetical protein [Bacillus sp. ISL-53]